MWCIQQLKIPPIYRSHYRCTTIVGMWELEAAELTTEQFNPALHGLWWLGVFDVF